MGSCDCGKGCAKCLLILFNVLFFLTGAALLAVGIWIRVDSSVWELINFASIDQDDQLLEYGAYVLIAVGGFILLTGLFGCCGALRESKICLSLYILVLVIVFIAEIAAGVLFIIFQDKVKDEFKKIVEEKFEDSDTTYRNADGEWSTFATTLNLVQKELECCGLDGPSDYTDTFASNDTILNCGGYPCSCYMLKDEKNDKNPNDFGEDDVNLDSLHEEGCETKAIEFFEQYSVVFIGLAIGFACIEIFGLIYAICLCQLMGDKKSKYTQ